MKKVILQLYQYFENKPTLLKGLLFFFLFLLIGALSLIHFSEDISDFLPLKENNKRNCEAYQHINTTNKNLVTISTKDTADGFKDKLITIADEFLSELDNKDTQHLTSDIFYKVSDNEITETTDFIVENLPYFMTSEDYQRLDSLLVDGSKIRRELHWNKEALYSPTGSFFQNIIINDPVHISNNILKKMRDAYQESSFKQHNGYIFNKADDKLLITLTSETPSSETSKNKIWIQAIDEASKATMAKHKDEILITHIGASEISIGNAEQIKKDTIISSVIALLLISVLLFFFYKDIRAIALILFSIFFGLLCAVGFLALFKDSISLIAVGIGSVIVGIAVNYPLHFLAHMKEGHSREETIKEIISPLVTGNITTVGAFLSLLFISSDAMKDMGLFAALLLVGTILFVLVFLPHLCKNSLFKGKEGHELLFGKIVNIEWEKKTGLVIAVLLLTIPLYYFSTKTSFETDLHKINYMTPEQRAEILKFTEELESNNAKLYCVCEGVNKNDALSYYEKSRETLERLKKEEKVIKVSGVDRFAPSTATKRERLEKWNEYWKANKEYFTQSLIREGESEGFDNSFFSPFIEKISQDAIYQDDSHFQTIQKTLTDLYIYEDNDKALVYTILECDERNMPYIEKQLGQIDESHIYTLNTKSFFQKMIETLTEDFNYVLFICAFIVFLFLTISFGRLELSLISFLPLTIGWIWILGIMNLCDIRFNIVNIILATFIFGQGDDYTIFVTEGLMYEYTHKKKVLSSYKNSVMLSACIMFIGIGALIVAKHPAMKSLAEVTIVGMFSVILMAYLFPPLLYKWLTTIKGEDRTTPITLKNLGTSIFSFIFFVIASLVLSIVGFFLLSIGGKSEKHKLSYHKIICNTFKRLAKIIPGVKHTITGLENHDFDKPSILICNHQSHLDLMYTLMLHPKIICLTNQWVWNSPFYGRIIRYAEFYPVSEGIEKSEETLKSAIDRGYSILIFPEGTRSEDCSILRFHQGAFLLAKRLHVNITPILVHGIGHVLPKKEFILRKGRVDIKILPNIDLNGTSWFTLDNTKEIAQEVKKYYKEEYSQMCKEIETPEYFKDQVYHNYIYKGAEIARKAKKNIFDNPAMEEWIKTLPDCGEYKMKDCGQGEWALIAALVKKDLHIIASDKDADNISIAKNCQAVPKNLEYILDISTK